MENKCARCVQYENQVVAQQLKLEGLRKELSVLKKENNDQQEGWDITRANYFQALEDILEYKKALKICTTLLEKSGTGSRISDAVMERI